MVPALKFAAYNSGPSDRVAMARPLYTAPDDERSTIMTPCVRSTVGFHPTMVPSSVEKMNDAGMPGAALKDEVPLNIAPVGAPPVLAVGVAMATINALATPLPLYSVDKPVLLSDTQNGLVGEATNPHGFTRPGSTLSAMPGRSETRLCCAN